MKIAVCGSGFGENSDIVNIAKEVGREIAKRKHTLVVGGCKGYPHAAEIGALLENGEVIVYSPAKNKNEHISKYCFPLDKGVKYIFTGEGIPERNIPLVYAADLVVILDGQTGTLNEFTIAFHEKKKIAVLSMGKLAELIPKIAEVCDKKGEKKNVFYFDSVKEFAKYLF